MAYLANGTELKKICRTIERLFTVLDAAKVSLPTGRPAAVEPNSIGNRRLHLVKSPQALRALRACGKLGGSSLHQQLNAVAKQRKLRLLDKQVVSVHTCRPDKI